MKICKINSTAFLKLKGRFLKQDLFPFLASTMVLMLLVISFLGGHAQHPVHAYLDDPGLVPRERFVDFKKLVLEVAFEPKKGLVKGTVTHTFSPLRNELKTLLLDGPKIRVKEATLNGQKTEVKTVGDQLEFTFSSPLNLDKEYTLKITYEANPSKGIYFIGWNDPNNLSRKQIWTQGQGIDNRHWIPMFDGQSDKVITETRVTMENGYTVLSNGVRSKPKDNKDGTHTWNFRMEHPHANYLLMLGIGKYEIKETKSERGTPMYSYYYPEWKDRVEPTYRHSEAMMDWFEKEIGVNYPWGSYSQIPVQDFMYGAMENTTATLFGDFFMVDERSWHDRNYVAVNAHELAHQWFGDFVTARSSAHHWLQESFATYYNTLYEQVAFGADHYSWKRRDAVKQALQATKKDLRPIAHSQAGTIRHYPKGAHVLHMLRYVVGDDAYRRSIKHYLEQHPYGSVDSEDLLIAFYETTGQALDWFWEEWVYHGGEPHYKLEFSEIQQEGKSISQFQVEQVHPQSELVGLFDMPIYFEVHYADGSKDRQKVQINEVFETVHIPNPSGKKVAYALFDPNSEVMKKVSFSKPTAMLLKQARNAANMIDRYDAIVALRTVPMAEKSELYQAIWATDEFHEILGEIVYQSLKGPEALWAVTAAMEHKNVQVQKHLVTHLDVIDPKWLPVLEPVLQNPSYITVAMGLEKLCIAFPDQSARFLEATKTIRGTRGSNVRLKWLEMALTFQATPELQAELIGYVSNSYEFLTRTGAAETCKRLNLFNETLLENLSSAVESNNGRLRRPCQGVLRHFYSLPEHRTTIQAFHRSREWEPSIQHFWNRL